MTPMITGWFWTLLWCGALFANSLDYAVIIDAGSSGSRAHVFSYTKTMPTFALPYIEEVFSLSTKPGLSSYANNPSAAGASLAPILNASKDHLEGLGVPLANVQLSVLATAGMRLLPMEKQEQIYANVRSYLRANYDFSLNDAHVRTITGQMEGLYGWLDVNYISNNFTEERPTIGSIDMGGASTQIVFATLDKTHPDDEINLTINQKPYTVFSRSFLGLGQDEARRSMTINTFAANCYPWGYAVGSIIGDFYAPSCVAIYTDLIQTHQVGAWLLPTSGQKFVAYSGIYHNFQFFNILDTPTQSALESSINRVCALSWPEMQANYPSVPLAHLPNYCASAVYFDALLFNTYHLQGDHQLVVTNKLNQHEIDWTLGALLYQLSQ